MRLAGYLAVPVVAMAVSAVGISIAAPAGAECGSRNDTMVCTDGPLPSNTAQLPDARSYPCIVGLTCDGTFESELVTGDGSDNSSTPNPPRPRPPHPNPSS